MGASRTSIVMGGTLSFALGVAAVARGQAPFAQVTTAPVAEATRAPVARPTTVPSTQPPATARAGASAPNANDFTTLSLEDLMNVDVTSVSKTKQRIGDSAAAVTVISQEDIQRSGLQEIPEILRLSPGLFVQRGNQSPDGAFCSRIRHAFFQLTFGTG